MRLLLALSLLILPVMGQTRVSTVSSNAFTQGTNSIYLAALAAIQNATNLLNLNTTNFVNVLNYGAIPDGVTDNQTAISNAWNNAPNGSTLYFPPGVYMASQLNMHTSTKTNFTIWGPGAIIRAFATNIWTISCFGTNITWKDITIDANNRTFYGVFQNNYCSRMTYKGVTIANTWVDNVADPSGINGSVGIYLSKGTDGLVIDGCRLENLRFASSGNVSRFCKGIFCTTSASATDYTRNVRVINSHFFNINGDDYTEGDCIALQVINSATNAYQLDEGLVIVGNTFENFSRRAVKSYGDGAVITGNFITATNSITTNGFPYLFSAISCYGARQVIGNNLITGPFYRAIDSDSGGSLLATNILIDGNYIHFSGTAGVYSTAVVAGSGTTNIIIQNNFISGNFTNGIWLMSSVNNARVYGNTINAYQYGIVTSTNGIVTNYPVNVYISRNRITNPSTGIYTAQGDTIEIDSNRGSASGNFIDTGSAINVKRFANGTGTIPAITTATLDFGSISAAGSEDLTITVTGASTGDTVSLSLPAAPTAGIVFNAFVSASNTVTVRASNITAVPVDPASASYTVQVFKQ